MWDKNSDFGIMHKKTIKIIDKTKADCAIFICKNYKYTKCTMILKNNIQFKTNFQCC